MADQFTTAKGKPRDTEVVNHRSVPIRSSSKAGARAKSASREFSKASRAALICTESDNAIDFLSVLFKVEKYTRRGRFLLPASATECEKRERCAA